MPVLAGRLVLYTFKSRNRETAASGIFGKNTADSYGKRNEIENRKKK